MIASHHDKNYAAAVKNLNKVETDLAALGKDARHTSWPACARRS